MPALLRFNGALAHDPRVDQWLGERPGELGDVARHGFDRMRSCGSEVRPGRHEGMPGAE